MTLIYGGAGWDSSFLEFEKYQTVYCYDAMPNKSHYNPGLHGYQYQIKFVETLCEKFGEYANKKDDVYTFKTHGKTIIYHLNFDFEKIDKIPDGDLYIAGYYPESTVKTFWDKIQNRKVIMNKNTDFDSSIKKLLRKNKCSCTYVRTPEDT